MIKLVVTYLVNSAAILIQQVVIVIMDDWTYCTASFAISAAAAADVEFVVEADAIDVDVDAEVKVEVDADVENDADDTDADVVVDDSKEEAKPYTLPDIESAATSDAGTIFPPLNTTDSPLPTFGS